jgi:hypothetical protein
MVKDGYVTKNEHTELEERVATMEAELMGDERTGRPSLRSDLTRKMDLLQGIAVSILIALIIGIVANWIGLSTKSAHAEQTQGK